MTEKLSDDNKQDVSIKTTNVAKVEYTAEIMKKIILYGVRKVFDSSPC